MQIDLVAYDGFWAWSESPLADLLNPFACLDSPLLTLVRTKSRKRLNCVDWPALTEEPDVAHTSCCARFSPAVLAALKGAQGLNSSSQLTQDNNPHLLTRTTSSTTDRAGRGRGARQSRYPVSGLTELRKPRTAAR